MAPTSKPAPMVLEFDIEDLTIGEIEIVEEIAGRELFEILEHFRARVFTAKELTAIVWVSGHRKDPSFTVEQARAVRFAEIAFDDTPPPANRADRRAKAKPKTSGSRRPPR